MSKIIAVNAGPRKGWNTDLLVKAAADGAKAAGAEVELIDLYQLEAYTGCVSCFGCKRAPHVGECIKQDGLTEVLEKIRNADGLIIGSPNYLSNLTAAFRALYERLCFQYTTYNKETPCNNTRKIPVVLIMTSNVAEEQYDQTGYNALLAQYRDRLSFSIGPCEVLACGDTLQVSDYGIYDWTNFDPEAKKARHDETFGEYIKKAEALGAGLVK